MLNGLHQVIAVLNASSAEAIKPVLLQSLLIKESVITAMAHLALVVTIARAEIANGVAPSVLQQGAKTKSINLFTPDAVGVGPWSSWIVWGHQGDMELLLGQGRRYA